MVKPWSLILFMIHLRDPRHLYNKKQTPAGRETRLEFVVCTYIAAPVLFLSPEVQTQRHVWQMSMIVLGPRTTRKRPQEPIFVVVVILVTKVPIEVPVKPNRQPPFRRLKTHGIRSDQRARISCRVRQTISLAAVFIDPVRGKQGHPPREAPHHIGKEVVVSLEIKRVPHGMFNAGRR